MTHRAGTVVIVGRPNVGKSTLLNTLIGQKVAIVSPKPQTTRTRIVGIRTTPMTQVVFFDTPGIHRARSMLNRRMVDVARSTIPDADVALLVIDATSPLTPTDREIAASLGTAPPAVVVLNKIDTIAKSRLLPLMAELASLLPGAPLVPASAVTGAGIDAVMAELEPRLPEGPALYPADEFTTETERALAQELVREQIFLVTRDEVPYGVAVVVDAFEEHHDRGLTVIKATILVERDTHKGILIGTRGARLKGIGTEARQAIEALLGTKVFLELFVRVEPGWSADPRRLAELGL